jgi:hypothetical protein
VHRQCVRAGGAGTVGSRVDWPPGRVCFPRAATREESHAAESLFDAIKRRSKVRNTMGFAKLDYSAPGQAVHFEQICARADPEE